MTMPGECGARKSKGVSRKASSLMDLAAKGKPAYFDGPFLTDEEAHGEKCGGDEELLEGGDARS